MDRATASLGLQAPPSRTLGSIRTDGKGRYPYKVSKSILEVDVCAIGVGVSQVKDGQAADLAEESDKAPSDIVWVALSLNVNPISE